MLYIVNVYLVKKLNVSILNIIKNNHSNTVVRKLINNYFNCLIFISVRTNLLWF